MTGIYYDRKKWQNPLLNLEKQVNSCMACDGNECGISPWSNVIISQGSLDYPYKFIKTFEELKIHSSLLDGLHSAGIRAPRMIQNVLFPVFYLDRPESAVVHAPGHVGKTTAAVIKALDTVLNSNDPKCQVFLICPTRDGASAVYNLARRLLGRYCAQLTFHLAVRDRVSSSTARQKITERFVVGTPEKVREYICSGHVAPENIRLIVLDGIDSTCGNGHLNAIKTMFKKVPPDSSMMILLSSATRDDKTDKFVRSLVGCPVYVELISKILRLPSSVIHHYLNCSSFWDKLSAITKLLNIRRKAQALIVCDSKDSAKDVYDELNKGNLFQVSFLHGKIKPINKENILKSFKDGDLQVLVITPTYRTSVKFHSKKDATIVNFDTQETRDGCLDHTGYKEKAAILNNMPGGLSINMIHDRWNEFATDEYGRKMDLCSLKDFETFLRGLSAKKPLPK